MEEDKETNEISMSHLQLVIMSGTDLPPKDSNGINYI